MRRFGALLQASIDGVVLLAMDSDSWTRLAAASSRPCSAPLERLRRASLELSSRPEIRNPEVPLTGSHAVAGYDDDADGPVRTAVRGDGTHERGAIDGIAAGKSVPDDGGGAQAPPGVPETDGASRGDSREAGLIGEEGKDAHEGTPTSPSRIGEGEGGRGFLDGLRPSTRDHDSGIDLSAVVAG